MRLKTKRPHARTHRKVTLALVPGDSPPPPQVQPQAPSLYSETPGGERPLSGHALRLRTGRCNVPKAPSPGFPSSLPPFHPAPSGLGNSQPQSRLWFPRLGRLGDPRIPHPPEAGGLEMRACGASLVPNTRVAKGGGIAQASSHSQRSTRLHPAWEPGRSSGARAQAGHLSGFCASGLAVFPCRTRRCAGAAPPLGSRTEHAQAAALRLRTRALAPGLPSARPRPPCAPFSPARSRLPYARSRSLRASLSFRAPLPSPPLRAPPPLARAPGPCARPLPARPPGLQGPQLRARLLPDQEPAAGAAAPGFPSRREREEEGARPHTEPGFHPDWWQVGSARLPAGPQTVPAPGLWRRRAGAEVSGARAAGRPGRADGAWS